MSGIYAHQGSLKRSDSDYNGCDWKVYVLRKNREISFELLSIIAKTDPVTCEIHAKENNHLGFKGWKKFARIPKRQNNLLRLTNQAKLESLRMDLVYHFVILIPRNHQRAKELGCTHGNNHRCEAELAELNSINEYGTFHDMAIGPKPKLYKKICYNIVYAAKHDLRGNARLVA